MVEGEENSVRKRGEGKQSGGTDEGAPADAVDERPGDEAGEEEPELQEAGHEGGEVAGEAGAEEERGGVICAGVSEYGRGIDVCRGWEACRLRR